MLVIDADGTVDDSAKTSWLIRTGRAPMYREKMSRYVKSRKRSAQQATPLEQSLTIAVASLREGEVVSFGDIAVRAGRPRAPRAAGAFLARSVTTLPWWRVVYADGRLPPCNPTLQTRCLEEEGVTVRHGRVRQAPWGRFADASH